MSTLKLIKFFAFLGFVSLALALGGCVTTATNIKTASEFSQVGKDSSIAGVSSPSFHNKGDEKPINEHYLEVKLPETVHDGRLVPLNISATKGHFKSVEVYVPTNGAKYENAISISLDESTHFNMIQSRIRMKVAYPPQIKVVAIISHNGKTVKSILNVSRNVASSLNFEDAGSYASPFTKVYGMKQSYSIGKILIVKKVNVVKIWSKSPMSSGQSMKSGELSFGGLNVAKIAFGPSYSLDPLVGLYFSNDNHQKVTFTIKDNAGKTYSAQK